MNLRLANIKWLIAIAFAIALAPYSVARAQSPVAPNEQASGTWRVRVKEENAYFLAVRAKEAPLAAIAAELARQLKAPVQLSRVMQKQLVTLDFQDLPLETALQLMAPLPYVYYELRGGQAPLCREVFLTAYNEPMPVPKLDNKNVSFVIQGHTEGEVKDDPIQVSYRNNLLTVRVKKQSIAAVLDRIASEIGTSLSINHESDELVDLDFKDLSLEDAMLYLPATAHLHVRKDIQRFSTLPMLVELAK